ncbi:MAG: RagB/SusD family nutrient uptake outer membrane protein [Bacteroidales bacterium]|nr:RagB/SusD family nutrient uptake outer membrane protein [Bacteroidales bacterium]
MKRILYAFSVAAALLAGSGCEKNFDPKIYGVLTSQNFPVSENDFESLMMSCYVPFVNTWTYSLFSSSGNLHPWYIPAGGVLKFFDATSDLEAPWINGVWNNDQRQLSEANFSMCVYYSRGTLSDDRPNSYPKTREVTRFTDVIGAIANAPATEISEERKMQILAEARLLRGLHMYNLFHIYGPVPVIVNPADVENAEALKRAVRPSLDEMASWIYDDFEFAALNMPESQVEKSRFNRDFAKVCLMRHCLNEGYHKDGWYSKAIEMYNELNNGRYTLFRQGDNPYREMFREANDFNCEIIAAISCDPSSTGNPKEGSMNPFAMLAMPNNCAKKDDIGNPTPFSVVGPGWGMTFNFSPKFYGNFAADDLRKESIITRYYTTSGEWWGPEQIGSRSEWDGYVPYKYPAETSTAPCFGNDFPLARWADVLLMFAEADVRLSGAAPSREAVDAVNEVRLRAGLAALPGSCTASAEAFLDELLVERGRELWFEGMRKIDLVRFNRYAQNCRIYKGKIPTHQYVPIPNYAVDEAAEAGMDLQQTWSREGWENDLAKAQGIR